MSIGLTTGIKALFAAQLSMQTAGHNIANAHVEGYSRQSVLLRTDYPLNIAGIGYLGTGVRTDGVVRTVDQLLESRLQVQNRGLGRLSKETSLLSQMEDIFQELGAGGLSTLISNFFGSINDLSIDPADPTLRTNMAVSGQILADGFHSMDRNLRTLESNIEGEIASKVQEVNQMARQIFELNQKIGFAATAGVQANDLYDKRNQLLKELNHIVDADAVHEPNGQVTVLVNGRIIASGNASAELEVKKSAEGEVTVHLEGDPNPLKIKDGEIKGLLNQMNSTIPELSAKLDTLAGQFAFAFNRIHATGIPKSGPFTSLRSEYLAKDGNLDGNPNNEVLAEAGLPFTPEAGSLFVTITNLATGAIEQTGIQVDPGIDSLETVAAKLDGVPQLYAYADSKGRLLLNAASGYAFDFSTRLDPAPDKTGSFGTVPVAMEGQYGGSSNTTWTFTASGTGTVGVTPGLTVTVADATGNQVAVLDVGEGYAPGDWIEVADGVKVSFGSGDLDAASGDAFDAKMIADSDTGGLLAALGVNAFFTGSTALDLDIRDAVVDDPSLIAAALHPNEGDNANVLRLAELEHGALAGLGSVSATDYYSAVVGKLGLDKAWADGMYQVQEILMTNLENQRASISGVSIDEELLNMEKYQQMLEAAVRYLQVMDESTRIIMNM